MSSDGFALYRHWIGRQKDIDKAENKRAIKSEVLDSLVDSAGYQENATINGNSCALIAVRDGTNKCKITLLPGTKMFIGDLVGVYGEKWLCVELYADEYGITSGVVWMCNQVFRFQDKLGRIIEKDAIIDDGSYAKDNDKSIPVTQNSFKCYMSLDEDSRVLHVDKRLAIDTIYNSDGEEILEAGKIFWIDSHTVNYGTGSHLMTFGLSISAFNREMDSLKEKICDYIAPIRTPEETPKVERISISGRSTIRIGTGRNYKAALVDQDGNPISAEGKEFAWEVSGSDAITIAPKGTTCTLTVPLTSGLIGTIISLKCSLAGNRELADEKLVEVISIG